MHGNAKDLTGERFGRLLVVSSPGSDHHGQRRWLCQCDCGNEKVALAGNLRQGRTQSCGCLALEVARNNKNKTHGMANSKAHTTWKSMKNRCFNPNEPAYKDYGGRGITVCERWMKFENFWADMGAAPRGCTLDRRDNDKGYSPENCRWASKREQALNTRAARLVTYLGVTKNLVEWARHVGLPDSTLRRRLFNGWSIERALTTPLRPKRQD